MFTTLMTVIVGSVTLVGLYFSSDNPSTPNNFHESTSSANATESAGIAIDVEVLREGIETETQTRINEATEEAQLVIEQQRQEAVDHVNDQFNLAIEKVEVQKADSPAFIQDSLDGLQDQLNQQQQNTVDRINSQLVWPDNNQ